MSQHLEVPKGSRILIVKLSSIGDVIMATPVAKALRFAFPDSHISWIVEPKAKDVIQGNPYVDEVIVWERPPMVGWNPMSLVAMWMSLQHLGKELRARKFDITIDLQGLMRSALVARQSGARRILGYANGREGSRLFYTHRFRSPGNSRCPQDYLDMLRLLGIRSADTEKHIPVSEEDRSYAQTLLDGEKSLCMPGPARIVALAPATTWPQKHWTVEGWAGLADGLISEHNALPVFLGAPGDAALISRIQGLMNNKASCLAGKTTLKQAAAVIQRSDLFVGVDTGLLHMSTALCRPSIGIFGATGWRHLAGEENLHVVAKDMPCMPCMRHPTCSDTDCMRAVTSQEVLDRGGRWLNGTLAAGRPVEVAPPVAEALEMPRFRTLHVETGMHSLGGPAQVVYLMTGLKKLGYDATLVCPRGSSVAGDAIAAGLDVITVHMPSDLDLTFVPKLYRIIKRLQPDIVHLHSRRGADVLGGIAARLAGVPAVVLSRRIDNPVRRGALSSLKYGMLCDKIITVSEAIRDVLIRGGADPSKIVCVHSVVEASTYDVGRDQALRRELGIPDDCPLIGIVAQLIDRKGHRYLFDAMPAVLERFPDTRLLVLGIGPLEAKLKNRADALGIGDRVLFTGFRRDIPRVLQELDVLVHPASMEGLGVAVLQAMAARLPVVATPVGGIPESVHDGVNGYLIPPRDAGAIADAVIGLLADPELRDRMGIEGRRIVEEQFCPDRMVEGVLSVYREVMKTGQRS